MWTFFNVQNILDFLAWKFKYLVQVKIKKKKNLRISILTYCLLKRFFGWKYNHFFVKKSMKKILIIFASPKIVYFMMRCKRFSLNWIYGLKMDFFRSVYSKEGKDLMDSESFMQDNGIPDMVKGHICST